jgi:protein-disulfide isomerase
MVVALSVAGLVLVAVLLVVLWPALTGGRDGYTADATEPPNANADLTGLIANPDAPDDHVLAIYEDYQCPVCAQAHTILGDVVAQAIEQNQLRVEYRTMTFLDRVNSADGTAESSTRAANAAACADATGVFVPFHDYLIEHQPTEGDGYTDQFLTSEVPAAIGLTGEDLSNYQSCYDRSQFATFVDDVDEAASLANVTGTPTYLLDGVKLSLSTASALQADIDAVLAGGQPKASTAASASATACVPSTPPTANPGPLPPHANEQGTAIVANPEAPADHVLAIYTDYQCPYCGQAAATNDSVLAQAMVDNKVRIEFRTMTFLDSVNAAGPTAESSTRAANAAACADGSGFFSQFERHLMLNQPTEGQGYTDQYLTSDVPAALGITGDALTSFQQCYSNRTYAAFVDYVATAAYYNCVTGTPTYQLDGKSVSWQSAAGLQAALDQVS